jgi:hypothetical protein
MLKKDFFNEMEYLIFRKRELETSSLFLLADVGLNEAFTTYSTMHKSNNPLGKRCLLTNRRYVSMKNFSMLKPTFKRTMAND